jgi:hypothetical protein
MWKWVVAGVAGFLIVALIVVGFFAWWFLAGPDVSQYEYLREPQISQKPDQRMLVVEAQGKPEVIAGKAIDALYQTYFRLEGGKTSFLIAPRARWPKSLDTPQSEWVGRFGLPVSDEAELPGTFDNDDPELTIRLQTWEYGQIAEILHLGPYDQEEPTIERLHRFIEAQDCKVVGEHEEEYIRGPGLFGPGDPKEYYTIIRLRIESQEE